MTWQIVAVVAVGAGLAVAGALTRMDTLVNLGCTVVGGALGLAVPKRATPAAVLDKPE